MKSIDVVSNLLKKKPRFFNELCRIVPTGVSRVSLAKALIKLEDSGKVKSALKYSKFGDWPRWVREYKWVKKRK